MIRLIACLAVVLSVAGCRDRADVTQAATTLIQNAGDTRVAKLLFGAIERGSDQAAEAVGFYSRGCQGGAEQLAETGPTWQAMRLSRNRNWGQPEWWTTSKI